MTVIRGDDHDNRDLFGLTGIDFIYGYGGDDIIDGFLGEDRLYGGTGNDEVYGSDDDDLMHGDDGDDILDGGGGADWMYGGLGNDTYFVENIDDFVAEEEYWYVDPDNVRLEWVAGGIDTIVASIDYTLEEYGGWGRGINGEVENLTLALGSAALTATGNDLDNILTGNDSNNTLTGLDGNDTLEGGAGADRMVGGLGNDTYGVDSAADTVTELAGEGTDTINASISYTLGANLENLTLVGSDAISGTGNDLDNVIRGNSGANALVGGRGNDSYHIGAGDTVTELAGEGIDSVFAGVSFTLGANLEHLTLTGSGAINGTGNALNNSIGGNAGNNTLDGVAGSDRMEGGLGNDTYYVDNAGDVVLENAGFATGVDTVRSSISYTLGANLENLTLIGTAGINGAGNGLDNILTGNGLVNKLSGGAGRDQLVGGGGRDTLTGGTGADVFRFNATTDGGSKGDAIVDFDLLEDKIALHHAGFGIAGTGTLASQGVDFVLGNAAVSTTPTVIFKAFVGEVWWDADGTGSGAAQLLAKVSLPALAIMVESDFIIV
jgi:Ca2+-binding RTX toxin-like protein